jgi:Fur family ferric uptake transcriptional regulator
VETWASRVAREHGYTAVEHTVEVFGLCPECTALGAGAAEADGGSAGEG